MIGNTIQTCAARLLKPLVRMLHRYGVPYGVFTDIAKRVVSGWARAIEDELLRVGSVERLENGRLRLLGQNDVVIGQAEFFEGIEEGSLVDLEHGAYDAESNTISASSSETTTIRIED